MVKTKCEIWSRVVGYLRPVKNWNEGKISEFADRTPFKPEVSAQWINDIPTLAEDVIQRKEKNHAQFIWFPKQKGSNFVVFVDT